MACKINNNRVWVAVYVWRGFVGDIQAFEDEKEARRQERSWRRQMNPTYDETAVEHVQIKLSTRRKPHKDKNEQA